ncbi:hypothetical protein C0992_009773, partial [Termitomyces sp. T32_za158]
MICLISQTVEVRAGPQGAKTKWVRIELRKVEILPGGGASNTFYDFVGSSPINLWQSSDEYGVLRSPETRQIIKHGATLVVDRNQLCHGPGDRISLRALLRSDTLSDTVLRGFELTLKEYSRFHPGQQAGKRAVPPQERVVIICESKLAINGALFPGQEHRAELTCSISENHTTTSLNSARHIDVTYLLCVKAIVDNVPTIVMDLPVIISNWQRGTSQEAV